MPELYLSNIFFPFKNLILVLQIFQILSKSLVNLSYFSLSSRISPAICLCSLAAFLSILSPFAFSSFSSAQVRESRKFLCLAAMRLAALTVCVGVFIQIRKIEAGKCPRGCSCDGQSFNKQWNYYAYHVKYASLINISIRFSNGACLYFLLRKMSLNQRF